MITIQEIKGLTDYLTKDYHTKRVAKQKEWHTYYDDTFNVPQIQKPMYLSRTGTGAWLIDGPTSHIITKNPQVTIMPKRTSESAIESAFKVTTLENLWVKKMLRQSPQPYREFVRNLMLRGEGWVRLILNENVIKLIMDDEWDKNSMSKYFPLLFLIPDPLNVFASPEEEYGIPRQLVMKFERSFRSIQMLYPEWSDPKNKDGKKGKIDWLEYWDKDYRYFEADGEPVLPDGINENVLGFVPFVHGYSGFGRMAEDGDPSSLVMGRLDKVRDLLIQECAINSDIDSTFHKFAHPKIDVFIPSDVEFDLEELRVNYSMKAGTFNALAVPKDTRIETGNKMLPSQEHMQHYYNIRARIGQEAPPIMSGLPSGSSGRQEDIMGYHYIRRYDSIVEATEISFAKILDMAREALVKIPNMLPITQFLEKPEGSKEVIIKEADIKLCSDTILELKAADPVEDDRKMMAGRALWKEKAIDWATFLTQYAGYTPDNADKIIKKTIAEQVVLQNPMILQLIAEKGIEQIGMKEEYDASKERLAQTEKVGAGSRGGEESRGGEPRTGNIKTEEGQEMVDMSLTQRGIRRPPQ